MFRRLLPNSALLAAVLALSAPVSAQDWPGLELPSAQTSEELASIALMGTVPIFWGEAGDMAAMLSGTARPHWARALLERDYSLSPLDYLSAEALAPYRLLMMAQPRGLSAEENVALDAWVRGGGRLLLFADPWMTGESDYAIGDRRRPQDVAMLSPVLAHWGLMLHFDPDADVGLELRDVAGQAIPVSAAGYFSLLDSPDAECALEAEGLLAKCRIGAGFAAIVADAAMLDLDGPHPNAENALDFMIRENLGTARETASEYRETDGIASENGVLWIP